MKKIGPPGGNLRPVRGSTSRQDSRRPPPRKRERVLYVEDNEDNWHVAQLRLAKSYDLVRAATDREACAVLTQEGPELYAVLMDVELGGSRLNGVELTKLVRGKLDPTLLPEYTRQVPALDIPILFVTAGGQAYPREQLLEAGADDVVAKPVDFTRLNVALANLYVKRILSHGQHHD